MSDAGPGELTPEPGAVMDPLVILIDQAGELVRGFASGDSFDPAQDDELAFEEVPVGVTAYVELLISDFAGNQDYVYFEGII